MVRKPRYLAKAIREDLPKKLVMVSGPRQVGKTTLAKALLGRSTTGYLSWDIAEHRTRILAQELPSTKLWVFDELHKYRSWRNYLKGVFDGRRTGQQMLVTGSAKLDVYRYGGDSLQGRYHAFRLHPLSVAELGIATVGDLRSLLALGGFPEPFLGASERAARRWSREYRSRLVQEEVGTLERVMDLGQMELLAMRLPDLVGSPLSLNALREDLQVSHKTVAHWVEILERVYAVFRLPPFGAPRLRAVKKEQKHYHFDWTLVTEPGPRFENLVASHLLKWVHYQQDYEGRDLELRYFRDIDGREVDLIVCERREPILAIEVKTSDEALSKGLRYFHARFPKCDAWQVSLVGTKDYVQDGVRIAPALELLRTLV